MGKVIWAGYDIEDLTYCDFGHGYEYMGYTQTLHEGVD